MEAAVARRGSEGCAVEVQPLELGGSGPLILPQLKQGSEAQLKLFPRVGGRATLAPGHRLSLPRQETATIRMVGGPQD